MGPTWVQSAPDGPHDGPTNPAIGDVFLSGCANRVNVFFLVFQIGYTDGLGGGTFVNRVDTNLLPTETNCNVQGRWVMSFN